VFCTVLHSGLFPILSLIGKAYPINHDTDYKKKEFGFLPILVVYFQIKEMFLKNQYLNSIFGKVFVPE
jgi:hypothetical protein